MLCLAIVGAPARTHESASAATATAHPRSAAAEGQASAHSDARGVVGMVMFDASHTHASQTLTQENGQRSPVERDTVQGNGTQPALALQASVGTSCTFMLVGWRQAGLCRQGRCSLSCRAARLRGHVSNSLRIEAERGSAAQTDVRCTAQCLCTWSAMRLEVGWV